MGQYRVVVDFTQRIEIALVGAQKSGTTTLAALLAQHPSVCGAKLKEAHLFDQEKVQRDGLHSGALLEHFPNSQPGQMLMDATPSYLYLPGCIESLIKHNPKIRILVVLRDPAERAVSHHAHERRLGHERCSFPMSLALERIRLQRDRNPLMSNSAHRRFSYIDRGRYSQQLQRLSALSQNFLVIGFSDLITNPQNTMNRIFAFLELPPITVGEVPHLNSRQDQPRLWHLKLAQLLLRRQIHELKTREIYRTGLVG